MCLGFCGVLLHNLSNKKGNNRILRSFRCIITGDYVKENETSRTCNKRRPARNIAQYLLWKTFNCPCTRPVAHAEWFRLQGIDLMYLCFPL